RAQDSGRYERTELARGMRVREGDQIRTRRDGSLRIVFSDRSLLNLGPSSSAVIQRYRVGKRDESRDVGIKLWAGKAWARVTGWFGSDNNFEVRTPNAVAGVRGTEFSVDVSPTGETSVTVFEGAVEVAPPTGGTPYSLLSPGERSRVSKGGEAVQETVSPKQLASDRKAAQRTGGLDPKSSDKRIDQAREQLDQAAPEPPENAPTPRERQRGAPAQQAPAPLDLDPASGESRVRGRVEIRQ
ncbi:MAG: FecR family protein, partial [Myxococcota bacterium]